MSFDQIPDQMAETQAGEDFEFWTQCLRSQEFGPEPAKESAAPHSSLGIATSD